MRKGCSVIFFVLFIIIFPGALFSFNLKQTVLSPSFYKETFRKIDFYNRLTKIDPQKAADYIASKTPEGGSNKIGEKQIRSMLTFLAPEDLQTTVEKNIDSYLLSSSEGEQNFAVDLTGIKSSMAKSPDANTREMVSQIPDTYKPPQTTTLLNKYSRYVPISKILSYFGFGFSILCLVLSLVLWPGWKGRLRMSGTVLLIFGIFILIGNLVIRPINIPVNFVADFLNGIAHDVVVSIKNSLLHLYLIEGFVMMGLGLTLLVISFFINNPESKIPVAKLDDKTK